MAGFITQNAEWKKSMSTIEKSSTLWNRGVPVYMYVYFLTDKVCYISKLHKSDIIVEQTTLKTVLEEY